jgi:hypothetical protein
MDLVDVMDKMELSTVMSTPSTKSMSSISSTSLLLILLILPILLFSVLIPFILWGPMPKLHIANVDFEFELSSAHRMPLQQGLERHPLFLQLQFMPLLYADPDDYVVVTAFPDEDYFQRLQFLGPLPKLILLSQPAPQNVEIVPWGNSQEVAAWAEEKRLAFALPAWDSVLRVNSKEFSYQNSPKLPHSCLVSNEEELKSWLLSFDGNKVLKRPLGLSGRGNLIIESQQQVKLEQLVAFCAKEWKLGRRLIAEPWVERQLDFSTQWHIHKKGEIEYIGSAIIRNSERGAYESTHVAEEGLLFGEALPFLEEHKREAKKTLTKVFEEGYFGPAGVDAMVFRDFEQRELRLHPVVEINARQTMSLFAIKFQRKCFVDRQVTTSYLSLSEENNGIPLLPHRLKETVFSKQLYLGKEDQRR